MPEEQPSMPPGALVAWGAGLYLFLALSAVLWLGVRDGAIPLALFASPDRWLQDLALGVAAAALVVGGWRFAVRLLPAAAELEALIAERLGPLSAAEVVTLALLSGFAEELFFRGAVQSQWGFVTATALFALLHLGPGREFRYWSIFALLAGALLGGLMAWRGSLLAPAVAHVAINLAGLARLRKLLPETGGEAS